MRSGTLFLIQVLALTSPFDCGGAQAADYDCHREIDFSACSNIQKSKGVLCGSLGPAYGQVIHNQSPDVRRENWVQYQFGLTGSDCGGPFALRIRFAMGVWPSEPHNRARPFLVGVNTESAGFGNNDFGRNTGGWTLDHQYWTFPARITLRPGQNSIRIFARNGGNPPLYGLLPYISEINLLPAAP